MIRHYSRLKAAPGFLATLRGGFSDLVGGYRQLWREDGLRMFARYVPSAPSSSSSSSSTTSSCLRAWVFGLASRQRLTRHYDAFLQVARSRVYHRRGSVCGPRYVFYVQRRPLRCSSSRCSPVACQRLRCGGGWRHTEGAQQACHRLLGVTQEDMETRSRLWHLSKAMCLISTGVLLYPATILWTVHSTSRMPSWYAASRSSAQSYLCAGAVVCVVCPLGSLTETGCVQDGVSSRQGVEGQGLLLQRGSSLLSFVPGTGLPLHITQHTRAIAHAHASAPHVLLVSPRPTNPRSSS